MPGSANSAYVTWLRGALWMCCTFTFTFTFTCLVWLSSLSDLSRFCFCFSTAHRPRCTSHSIVYSSRSSPPHLENIFMIELNASCEVTFRGNLTPIMEWRSGNTSEPITEGVNTTITEHHNLTSTLMTTVHSSELPHITCTTKFEKGITGPGSATNVPSLVFNWDLPLESCAYTYVSWSSRG